MRNESKGQLSWLGALLLIPGLLILEACSSSPTYKRRQNALADVVAARGLDPEQVIVNEVNDDMRAWLRERVPKQGGSWDRLNRLILALNDPYAIQLEYDTR